MDRFWSKVNKDGGLPSVRQYLGECWIWTGAKSSAGYGQIRISGVCHYVHRHVLTISDVEIPSGMQVDHLCRNKACCNPKHLEVVTARVNIRRAFDDTRKCCPKGHEYTPENTRWLHGGRHRKCRICNRIENSGVNRVRVYTPEQLERKRARARITAAAYHARMKDNEEFKEMARQRARAWKIKNKPTQNT